MDEKLIQWTIWTVFSRACEAGPACRNSSPPNRTHCHGTCTGHLAEHHGALLKAMLRARREKTVQIVIEIKLFIQAAVLPQFPLVRKKFGGHGYGLPQQYGDGPQTVSAALAPTTLAESNGSHSLACQV